MSIIFIRAFVLYVVVIVSMRVMGKRQIGQLQPFELAIAIMISELAAVPMQNRGIPILAGIVPIATLVLAQILFSFIAVKSIKARKLISGKPVILVQNGFIREQALKNEMITLNDLMEQLRIKNHPNISDVDYAILETNGQISVIPKPSRRPVITADLKIDAAYEGLPVDLIMDGIVMGNNLAKMDLDRGWLEAVLKKNGVTGPKDILYASITADGTLFYQHKGEPDNEK